MAQSIPSSAAEIVAAIRDKKITATAVTKAAIERAEQLKDLNAFIFLNKDGALVTAAEIDDGQNRCARRPADRHQGQHQHHRLPTSGGTPALQNVQPRTNAPSLQALFNAGAIIIGKTNLHELAFGITSTNLSSFAGPVRNPYDKTRIPGGSSGGTAAAIAAGIVTCGLGTDTGGSTRIPAALTGTVGLRPSVGNGGVQRRYNDPTWWSRSAIPATPSVRWAAPSPTWRCWIPSSPARRWLQRSRCAANGSASRRRFGPGWIATLKT